MTPEFEAQRDDAYRALGRYIAEYSQLFLKLRWTVATCLQREVALTVPLMAIGGLGDNRLTVAFFSICKYVGTFTFGEPTPEDDAIAAKFQKAVEKEIRRRNEFAHGTWWIGWGLGDQMAIPNLWPTGPGRNPSKRSAADLDKTTDAMVELQEFLGQFSDMHLRSGVHMPGSEIAGRPVKPSEVFRINKEGRIALRPDSPYRWGDHSRFS
jgi:hypothetical protein